MDNKRIINREKMTKGTFNRLLKHNKSKNIYDLINLAIALGMKPVKNETTLKVKATQFFIDQYNQQITDAKRATTLEKANKKRKATVYKNKVYKNIKDLVQGGITEVTFNFGNMIPDLKKFDLEKVFEDLLNQIPLESMMVLEVNGKFYSLSKKFRDKILSEMKSLVLVEIIEGKTISDAQLIYEIQQNLGLVMKLSKFDSKHKNRKMEGAFFPYKNTTMIDLTPCQIFNQVIPCYYEYNCLIYALMQSGLETLKMNTIKQVMLMCKTEHVPFTVLENIANVIEHTITVRDSDANKNLRRFGNFENTIELGLINNHYFHIYKTDYTSYSIENYEKIKHLPNFNEIFQETAPNKYSRTKTRGMDSYKLIKKMIEKNMFTPMTMEETMKTQYGNGMTNVFDILEYNKNTCIKPIEIGSPKKIDRPIIIFDFETTPIDIHEPYLCCCYDGVTLKTFYGADCGKQLLEYIPTNTQLIAHNAGYDYRFLIKYLINLSEISRGNHLLSAKGMYFGKKIFIKDSYNLITMPLRDFGKTFKLNVEKDIMPYKLYTKENVENVYVSIDEALQYVKSHEQQQFLQNIEKWNLKKDNTYNIIEYSAKYCQLDCIVLFQGYKIFSEWIQTQLNIDLANVLTSASLAHTYFVNEGCYIDVNQISGVPQAFIQETVVGGRCMVANNQKIHRSGNIDNDFDATSLYPSAMRRLGFLQGIPKVIKDFRPHDYDGYFIEIKITNVGVKRDFPLMSYKREDGVRDFTNDMVGRFMKVDKTTLEDLIEFHKIKYEFIRGYYFDEGFNYKIQETILYLFNRRLNLKKEGNPAELIYKLIMNSGYGKSIMKPIEYENVFFNNESEFKTYWCRNHNYIKEGIQFGKAFKIKKIKPLNEHFNIAHVGTSILSMSKRIMNEVMCTGEDNGCKMFYQDTDSIHISNDDITKLEKVFKEKYNRDLIGKRLGQFHSDFSIDNCENIVAVESIFLGKKSYIDVIQGKDKDTGEIKQDYHIRLKGIPNQVILNYCEKQKITPLDLYKQMYKGKKISFDLTDGSTCFDFKPDYSIITKTVFTREINF